MIFSIWYDFLLFDFFFVFGMIVVFDVIFCIWYDF